MNELVEEWIQIICSIKALKQLKLFLKEKVELPE